LAAPAEALVAFDGEAGPRGSRHRRIRPSLPSGVTREHEGRRLHTASTLSQDSDRSQSPRSHDEAVTRRIRARLGVRRDTFVTVPPRRSCRSEVAAGAYAHAPSGLDPVSDTG